MSWVCFASWLQLGLITVCQLWRWDTNALVQSVSQSDSHRPKKTWIYMRCWQTEAQGNTTDIISQLFHHNTPSYILQYHNDPKKSTIFVKKKKVIHYKIHLYYCGKFKLLFDGDCCSCCFEAICILRSRFTHYSLFLFISLSLSRDTFNLKRVCTALLRFTGWTTCFLLTVWNSVQQALRYVLSLLTSASEVSPNQQPSVQNNFICYSVVVPLT